MSVVVYHRHMKVLGLNYCNRGARVWFQHHGLDWSEFVKNGLPEEILIATGDAMAFAVVEEARKEWVEKAVDRQ